MVIKLIILLVTVRRASGNMVIIILLITVRRASGNMVIFILLITVRRESGNKVRDCSNGQYVSELAEQPK